MAAIGRRFSVALRKTNEQHSKIFADHAHIAWRIATGSDAGDRDLVDLARLFRIRRFGVDKTSGDWREASNLIGARLFGREEVGGPPTLALLNIVRQLIQSGAAADRAWISSGIAGGRPR